MKTTNGLWLPMTIFLVVLFGGVIAIGLCVAYGMPCPAGWTGEWRQKWASVQVRSFCMWSTAWAVIVQAVCKIVRHAIIKRTNYDP